MQNIESTVRALAQLVELRNEMRERERCPVAPVILALLDVDERLLLADRTVDFVRDHEDSGLTYLDMMWSWFVTASRTLDLDRVDSARASILTRPDENATAPALTLHDRALLAIVLSRPSLPISSPASLPPSIPPEAYLKSLEPAHFNPYLRHELNPLPEIHEKYGKHSPETFRFLEIVARCEGAYAFCHLMQVGEPSLPAVATPALKAKVKDVLERDLRSRRNFELVLGNAIFGSLCRWGALALRERRGVRVFNAADPLRDSYLVPLGDALEKKDEFTTLSDRIKGWRSQGDTSAWPEAWRQVALMECWCEWLAERVVDPLREVEDKGVGKTGIVAIETFFSRNSYLRWYEWGTEKAKAKASRSVLHGRPCLPQIWHLGDRRWWVRVGGAPEGVQLYARAKGEGRVMGGGGERGWVKCETAVDAVAEWIARTANETFEFGTPIPPLG